MQHSRSTGSFRKIDMFGFNNKKNIASKNVSNNVLPQQQSTYWLDRDQQGYFVLPYRLATKSLEDTVFAGSSGFEQILARKQPFVEFSIKTYKQTKKNMPEGWIVEKDGLVVMEGNNLIGTVSSDIATKNSIKSAKDYRAFVVPPCRDPYEGIVISDIYSLRLILK